MERCQTFLTGYTYLVNHLVWELAIISEWWNASEPLSELVLVHIKRCTLLANIGYLVGLQWCHLLFDSDSNLLGVIPVFRKLLKVNSVCGISNPSKHIFICNGCLSVFQ